MKAILPMWVWWLPIAVANAQPVADPIAECFASCPGTASGSSPTVVDALLARFYEARSCRMAWSDTESLDHLIDQIRALEDDGLTPSDYFLDRLVRMREQRLIAGHSDPIGLDVLATRAYLLALRHLYHGKVAPQELYPDWNFEPRSSDPAEDLGLANSAVDDGNVAAAFALARPPHAIYGALRKSLHELRAIAADGGWPLVPAGPTLARGMRDPRIPALRHRLALGGYGSDVTDNVDYFDPALEVAVRAFQTEQYLGVDGKVGAATRNTLNVSIDARIGQLQVNLERVRWIPEITDDFVLVDIAGYKVSYYKNSGLKWASRVQVGRPYRRTPSFRSMITHVTFNPTWTVPPTILRNDVLPKIRRDSSYLATNRLRAFDPAGNPLDAAAVDWHRASGITLRQDAGPGNALGRVAIRFPNRYGVYLHDTPHTELFDREQRAFSSGCIRVERPLELVELLLDDAGQWNHQAMLAEMDSGVTRSVILRRPVPLLLMYWSVDVHDGGRVAYKFDVYQRDAKVLAALHRSPLLPDTSNAVRDGKCPGPMH